MTEKDDDFINKFIDDLFNKFSKAIGKSIDDEIIDENAKMDEILDDALEILKYVQ